MTSLSLYFGDLKWQQEERFKKWRKGDGRCFVLQVCAVVHRHGAAGLRLTDGPPCGGSWRWAAASTESLPTKLVFIRCLLEEVVRSFDFSISTLCSASGHTEVVRFLLEACKVNPVPRDRWVQSLRHQCGLLHPFISSRTWNQVLLFCWGFYRISQNLSPSFYLCCSGEFSQFGPFWYLKGWAAFAPTIDW